MTCWPTRPPAKAAMCTQPRERSGLYRRAPRAARRQHQADEQRVDDPRGVHLRGDLRVVLMSKSAFSAGISRTAVGLGSAADRHRAGPDILLQSVGRGDRLSGSSLSRPDAYTRSGRRRSRGTARASPAAPLRQQVDASQAVPIAFASSTTARAARRSGVSAPENENASSRPISPNTAPSTAPNPTSPASGSSFAGEREAPPRLPDRRRSTKRRREMVSETARSPHWTPLLAPRSVRHRARYHRAMSNRSSSSSNQKIDGIATFTLNRPNRMKSLTTAMLSQLVARAARAGRGVGRARGGADRRGRARVLSRRGLEPTDGASPAQRAATAEGPTLEETSTT